MHISWARLTSFCHLGFISDPLIVSKFHNKTHDPKGQENKIYTIVRGRETFYRRHTVPVTSCSEVKYVLESMENGLCPDYLTSRLPATVCSASAYSLRNSSDLQTLHTHSCIYYILYLFLASVVHDLNEFPEQTRNSSSLNNFKNRLNSILSTAPRYYSTCIDLTKYIMLG